MNRGDSLQQLHISLAKFVTTDLRQKYLDVREFISYCEDLSNEWKRLKQQLEQQHTNSIEKVHCIHLLYTQGLCKLSNVYILLQIHTCMCNRDNSIDYC